MTVGLVLAAGAGTRLGRGPKALLPMGDGGPTLAEHVARTLLDGGCTEVVVVIGAGAGTVAGALDGIPGVRCADNPDWPTGMGSSLRTGLAAVGPDRDVLVTPVDRPGLSAVSVARVIVAHRSGGITAAAHRDGSGRLRRGHPVLLAADWTAAAAEAAHDDVGARDLLAEQRDLVQLVETTDIDDGGDVDRPADLWRLSPEERAGGVPWR